MIFSDMLSSPCPECDGKYGYKAYVDQCLTCHALIKRSRYYTEQYNPVLKEANKERNKRIFARPRYNRKVYTEADFLNMAQIMGVETVFDMVSKFSSTMLRKQLGLGFDTISNLRKKHGVKTRKRGGDLGSTTQIDKNELIKEKEMV